MCGAVKAVTSERGRDPRRRARLVGFGGAGPLYAAEMARELRDQTVLEIRRTPGCSAASDCWWPTSSARRSAPMERRLGGPRHHRGTLRRARAGRHRGPGVANGHRRLRTSSASASPTCAIAGQRSELRVSTRGGAVEGAGRCSTTSGSGFHDARHERTYGRRGARRPGGAGQPARSAAPDAQSRGSSSPPSTTPTPSRGARARG